MLKSIMGCEGTLISENRMEVPAISLKLKFF